MISNRTRLHMPSCACLQRPPSQWKPGLLYAPGALEGPGCTPLARSVVRGPGSVTPGVRARGVGWVFFKMRAEIHVKCRSGMPLLGPLECGPGHRGAINTEALKRSPPKGQTRAVRTAGWGRAWRVAAQAIVETYPRLRCIGGCLCGAEWRDNTALIDT